MGIKGRDRGRAAIYVDGAYVGTADLYAPSPTYRSIVYTRYWASSAAHKVTIKVLGTSGRPRVDVDGFYTFR